MKIWNKFCGAAAFFLTSLSFLQAQPVISFQNKVHLADTFKLNITLLNRPLLLSSQILKNNNSALTYNSITPDYYTKHLGFMCKKELALEKTTKIPFRFRLGSLQQCNYLEGKK